MQTDRFEELRKISLTKIFDTSKMTRIWRDIVRNQLRSLDFQDYFDNYDLNYNIEQRVNTLKNEILKGAYKSSTPLIYKLEKKLGICRHIVIPNAIDALVMQILIEEVADQLLKNQPSKNSFYSRDKHNKANITGIHDSNDLKTLWKKMQREIYQFQKDKELIVVTDLSNYYDSIHISELKKVLASYSQIEEVLFDILFKIIEDISWRPDYLPYSFRGLPTTNLEGVRLLAHTFLFEIDNILNKKSKESFTRWMDDITFAVDSRKEAVIIINSISDLLKSRGLALNLSKTQIFNKNQALEEFLIEENRYIDECEKILSLSTSNLIDDVINRFKSHLTKNTGYKYYEKVTKRYLTLISKIDPQSGYPFLSELYLNSPALRDHILIFLGNNKFDIKSSELVIEIIKKIEIFDDISLHQIVKLVCKWEVPINDMGNAFIDIIDQESLRIFKAHQSIMNYLSVLMLKTKYSHHEELYKFIIYWKAIWEDHSYGRRQVMACLSRLINTSRKENANKLIQSNMSTGILAVITLCNQIESFAKINSLEPKMWMYLFPTHKPKFYPFYKFLVLCSVLNSEDVRQDPRITKYIKSHITDPYYLKWIEQCYNIK